MEEGTTSKKQQRRRKRRASHRALSKGDVRQPMRSRIRLMEVGRHVLSPTTNGHPVASTTILRTILRSMYFVPDFVPSPATLPLLSRMLLHDCSLRFPKFYGAPPDNTRTTSPYGKYYYYILLLLLATAPYHHIRSTTGYMDQYLHIIRAKLT